MSSSFANTLYSDACRARVAEAKARLTLRDVWDLAPFASQEAPPEHGLGVVRSPLRADKTPSFSIFAGGRAFADKARPAVKGDVWKFIALCCPEKRPGDICRLMVERAGLAWPDRAAFDQAKGEASEGDKAKAARLREERKARERFEQAQRDQRERERRADRSGDNLRGAHIPPAPVCVVERWEDGVAWEGTGRAVEKLCERRGWPASWADMLRGGEVLSFPLEPRWEAGEKGAKRMVAFRVEMPVADGRGGATLRMVGYHQKFFNVQTQDSGWRFVPSSKRPALPEARWSSMQRAMVAAATTRGVEPGRAMVPPLPFVAGCVVRPRLVIILEGQWDALTIMGALGGLHPDGYGPQDVAYFGVRGVNGVRAFLEYWGPLVRAWEPLVWLLPDNDGAKTGGQWYAPARAAEREPGVLYFSERLRRLGARNVVVTPLRGDAGAGKDFNDYFRAAKPSAEAMAEWMGKLGLGVGA